MPDSKGTTGRDGSARDTNATASPRASRPTVNLISPILALGADISERTAPRWCPHQGRSGWPRRRCSQRGLDRPGQVPRRVGGQLNRHPGRRPLSWVDEGDSQRVVGQGVGRVIEIDADLAEPKPAARALPAASGREMLGGVGAHDYALPERCSPKNAQIFSQPSTAASTRYEGRSTV